MEKGKMTKSCTRCKETELFYENLEMAIKSLLNNESLEETFDWELEGLGILGYKCWKEGETIKVEIKFS